MLSVVCLLVVLSGSIEGTQVQHTTALAPDHQLRPAAGKGKHIEFNDVGQNTVELWTLESGGGWIHPVHIHLVVRIFSPLAVLLVLASCLAAHLPVDNSQSVLLETCGELIMR